MMSYASQSLGKKIVALLMIALLIAPAPALMLAPPPAHAFIVITDLAGFIQRAIMYVTQYIQKAYDYITSAATKSIYVKEYVLDPLAWAGKQTLIQSITGSVVNFVNGTNKSNGSGKSQFVTNLGLHLRGVGDNQTLAFLGGFSSQSNSPFAGAITSSLRGSYIKNSSLGGFFASHQDTLSRVSSDANSFLSGNFKKGGWSAWFSLTTQEENNPYALHASAQTALAGVIGNAQKYVSQEISQNQGFISWCDPGEDKAPASDTDPVGPQQCFNKDGNAQAAHTPGSLIKDSVSKNLGTTVDQLVAADEISEILAQLAVNFVVDSLGGSGGGLSGLSGGRVSDLVNSNPLDTPGGLGIQNAAQQAADARKRAEDYIAAWTAIGNAANIARDELTAIINYAPYAFSTYAQGWPAGIKGYAENGNPIPINASHPCYTSDPKALVDDATTAIGQPTDIGLERPAEIYTHAQTVIADADNTVALAKKVTDDIAAHADASVLIQHIQALLAGAVTDSDVINAQGDTIQSGGARTGPPGPAGTGPGSYQGGQYADAVDTDPNPYPHPYDVQSGTSVDRMLLLANNANWVYKDCIPPPPPRPPVCDAGKYPPEGYTCIPSACPQVPPADPTAYYFDDSVSSPGVKTLCPVPPPVYNTLPPRTFVPGTPLPPLVPPPREGGA